jgi:hypothetical protein
MMFVCLFVFITLFQKSVDWGCFADVPYTVGSMKLVVNQLDGQQHAVPTAVTETVKCGLVFRSIGYRSTQVDPDVPFDTGTGHVPIISGAVQPGKYTLQITPVPGPSRNIT